MANRFAILAEYPAEGPPMPEQEKVRREKDRHDPGTGRRDKVKREGRGPGNWGNPLDDVKHAEAGGAADEEAEAPAGPAESAGAAGSAEAAPAAAEAPEPERPYVAASIVFGSSSDDEAFEGVPKQAAKQPARVPAEFQSLIASRPGTVELHRETNESGDGALQLGFLSARDALKQQSERYSGGRGGFRGGRGGGGRGRGGGGGGGGGRGGRVERERGDRDRGDRDRGDRDRVDRDERWAWAPPREGEDGPARRPRPDREGEDRPARRPRPDRDDRGDRPDRGERGDRGDRVGGGGDGDVRDGPRRRGGRDGRVQAVQHQRDTPNPQGGRRSARDGRVNANDFPSLH